MWCQGFISLLIFVLVAILSTSTAEDVPSAEIQESTLVRKKFPFFRCRRLRRRCHPYYGPPCCKGTVCRRSFTRFRRRTRRCVKRGRPRPRPAPTSSPSPSVSPSPSTSPTPSESATPSASPSPSASATPSSSVAPFSCDIVDDTEMVGLCRCFYDDPSLMPTTLAQFLEDSAMCFPSVSTRDGNVEIFTRAPLCTASCPDGSIRTSIGFISFTTTEGTDPAVTQDCLASLVKPIFSALPRTTCEDAAMQFFPDGMPRTVDIEVPDSVITEANCGITPRVKGPTIVATFGRLNDLAQLNGLACGF